MRQAKPGYAPVKLRLLFVLVCFQRKLSVSLLLKNGAQLVDKPNDFKLGKNYQRIQSGQNSSVHDWHGHAETVQSCKGESLSALTTGRWHINGQGHYLYEPASCVLRRFSGEGARRYAPPFLTLTADSSQVSESDCTHPLCLIMS